MHVEQVFSKAWQAYKKNWKQLFYANFLFMFVGSLLFLIFIASVFLELSQSYFSLQFLPFLLLLPFFIVVGILKGGIIHISYTALKKNVYWKEMLRFSKEHWLPILIAFFVEFVIISIIFLPSEIIKFFFFSSKPLEYLFIYSLVFIPSFLVSLLFCFVLYVKIIENLPIVACIKRSFEVVKSSYIELLIILFLYSLIVLMSVIVVLLFAILLGITIIGIPFAMALVVFYLAGFLMPFSELLYVSYYTEAMEGRKIRKRF